MSLDSKTRYQLRRETARLAKTSARLLMEDNDVEAAKESLDRAELAGKILAATEKSASRSYISIGIGFICLILAGLVWSVRIPVTEIDLKIEAEGVTLLRLSEDWATNIQVTPQAFYLNNINELTAPGLGINASVAVLELSGQAVTLQQLGLSAGASVEMESRKDELVFYVHKGVLSGKLNAAEARLSLTQEGNPAKLEIQIPAGIPETLAFKSIRSTAEPVKLVLDTPGTWDFSGFQTEAFRVCREDPPGTGRCVSTLHSGMVKLLATGRSVQLMGGDQLIVRGVRGTRIKMASNEHGIQLIFQGAVNAIKAGPAGFEQDLAPSWLEYLYHQKQLIFFWSVIVFLWGMLWSLRSFW